jgi:putative PIN family toxin of toxin-antitoxin system
MRVVIDTNVFISALLTAKGNASAVIRSILTRQVEMYGNPTIFAEYEGVALRPKFAKSIRSEDVRKFIDIFNRLATPCFPEPSTIPFIDETDRIFYDTAKEADAWLVTGNRKHYPAESLVVNPVEFLGKLED